MIKDLVNFSGRRFEGIENGEVCEKGNNWYYE
jgi:hypothetical protein